MIQIDQQEFKEYYLERRGSLQKMCLTVGASMYLTSALIALWSGIALQMLMLARMLLFNGVFLILTAETMSFIKKRQDQTRYTVAIYSIEALGYLLLLFASVTQELYNHGALYMVGSFLISISKELIIVMLLVPKSQVSQKRNTFLSALNSCCSALLFFFGALALEVNLDAQIGKTIGGSLSLGSGMLVCLSIVYMMKGESHDGYRGIKLDG